MASLCPRCHLGRKRTQCVGASGFAQCSCPGGIDAGRQVLERPVPGHRNRLAPAHDFLSVGVVDQHLELGIVRKQGVEDPPRCLAVKVVFRPDPVEVPSARLPEIGAIRGGRNDEVVPLSDVAAHLTHLSRPRDELHGLIALKPTVRRCLRGGAGTRLSDRMGRPRGTPGHISTESPWSLAYVRSASTSANVRAKVKASPGQRAET